MGQQTENMSGCKKIYYWKAFYSSRVLLVTVATVFERDTGFKGDWATYIGAVPGTDHSVEWREVAYHGDKVPEDFARANSMGPLVIHGEGTKEEEIIADLPYRP